MILKLAENKYIEWSTIADAPTTWIMDREEMEKLVRNNALLDERISQHDCNEVNEMKRKTAELVAKKRLERIEDHGSSGYGGTTVQNIILGNRAGPKEAHLTLDEIIETYTYSKEKAGKWPFN